MYGRRRLEEAVGGLGQKRGRDLEGEERERGLSERGDPYFIGFRFFIFYFFHSESSLAKAGLCKVSLHKVDGM